MKKIKVSFLGCGRIFTKHYKAILSNKKSFIIEAICDVNIKQINLQISNNNKIKKFTNINKFIKNTSSDLYVILTPSGLHCENILTILRSKKNVLVEKPIVINSEQSKKILNFMKTKRNKNIFVVKQNRYNPAIQFLKKIILKQTLGNIYLATVRLRWNRNEKYFAQSKWRGTWKIDGGVLANQASHHIDLLQWLVGDIKRLYGYGSKITKKIKAYDTVVSVLDFKSGAKGIIEATTATSPKNLEGSISILGTKGTVIIGGYAVSKLDCLELSNSKKKKFKDHMTKLFKNNKDVYGNGHKVLYSELVNFFNKKKYNIPNYKDAIKSVKIFDKIYGSIESSKEVYLNDKIYSRKLGK